MNPLPASLLTEYKSILSAFRLMVNEEPATLTSLNSNPLLLLQTQIEQCSLCTPDQQKRTHLFRGGDIQASIMVVATSLSDSHTDSLLKGEAGELLYRMFSAIDIPPDALYITTLTKCLPADSGLSPQTIIRNCRPYLKNEIAIIKPELICCLSLDIATEILQKNIPEDSPEGQFHNFNGIPLVILPHPALLLEHPEKKRKAWDELQRIQKHLNQNRTSRANS